MVSEAIELCVEGGVSHSWCMGVVSHGYGGLGWGRVVCMLDKARGLSLVGRCQSTSKVPGDTLMTHCTCMWLRQDFWLLDMYSWKLCYEYPQRCFHRPVFMYRV